MPNSRRSDHLSTHQAQRSVQWPFNGSSALTANPFCNPLHKSEPQGNRLFEVRLFTAPQLLSSTLILDFFIFIAGKRLPTTALVSKTSSDLALRIQVFFQSGTSFERLPSVKSQDSRLCRSVYCIHNKNN